jgi:hypothetical protein
MGDGMTDDLTVAGYGFALDDAKAIIAGYCFGEVTEPPDPPAPAYGEPPQPWRRARFGYRSYDCQRGSREGIDIVDIVAPVLLNVTQGYGVEIVSNLLAVAPGVNEVMRQVPSEVSFWMLPRADLEKPQEGTPNWCLHRAWYLIESVPGCGLTKTHKILHHAWPHLFPLIDRQTRTRLGDNLWLTIYDDLKRHEGEFDELETWFATLAGTRGGVALTRLRLHDILLWCGVTEEANGAGRFGRILVRGGGPSPGE